MSLFSRICANTASGSVISATNTSPSSTAPTRPNAKAASPAASPTAKLGSTAKTAGQTGSSTSAWAERRARLQAVPLLTTGRPCIHVLQSNMDIPGSTRGAFWNRAGVFGARRIKLDLPSVGIVFLVVRVWNRIIKDRRRDVKAQRPGVCPEYHGPDSIMRRRL